MSDHIQKKETGDQSGVMFEAGGSLPETEDTSPESGWESLKTLVNKQKMAPMALRDQEAAGSNPVTPMRKTAKTLSFGGLLIFAFGGLTTWSTIDRRDFGIRFFWLVLFRFSAVCMVGGGSRTILCLLWGRICLLRRDRCFDILLLS